MTLDSRFFFWRVKKELFFFVDIPCFFFDTQRFVPIWGYSGDFQSFSEWPRLKVLLNEGHLAVIRIFCSKIPREHIWIDTGNLEWKKWPGWFGKRYFFYCPFSSYMNRALFWVSGVTCQGNTPIQTLSPPVYQRNRESLWPKKDSQRSRHTYLHRSKGELQPVFETQNLDQKNSKDVADEFEINSINGSTGHQRGTVFAFFFPKGPGCCDQLSWCCLLRSAF